MHFILSLFIMIPFMDWGQVCYKIPIEKNSKEINNTSYYFTDVIDGRADKSTIGIVYSNVGSAQCSELKNGFYMEFISFLQGTYTNVNAQDYVIKVTKLLIKEPRNQPRKESASVFLDMDFYTKKNDRFTLITSTSKTITEEVDDATFTHPNRIKRAILLSINDFDAFLKKNTNKDSVLKSVSYQELTNGDTTKRYLSPPAKDKQKPQTIGLVNGILGLRSYGFGINFGGVFNIPKLNRLSFGALAGFNIFTLNSRNEFTNNPGEILYTNLNFGFHLMYKVKPLIRASVGLDFIFGKERYSTVSGTSVPITGATGVSESNYKERFSGFQFEQGLLFIRPQKAAVFGLSIFERSVDASLFDGDVGARLSFGLNF